MAKLLVVDTETGGLDPVRCSLLTLGAVIWEDERIIAEVEWAVREPTLQIEPASLKEHQVDLREVAAKGRPPAEVAQALLDFARPHFGAEKIVLAGHNIGFDAGFLRRLFGMAGLDYESSFSHRLIDTSTVLGILGLAGRISIRSRGLSEAIEYFKLPVDPARRHTALEDARVTALLLTKLVQLVRGS